jgi:CheY-like chemotaxis protein
MKVLVVDDNEATARIIQQLITADDRRVRTAYDGVDGYVITDIDMPGKNGFELMKKIRTHNPAIKTIYMSGNLSRFDSLLKEEKRRYHAGVLRKPFSMDDLIRLVTDNQRSLKKSHNAPRLRLLKTGARGPAPP